MATGGKSVLAIAAHPDDIEFGMAGTLLLLAEQGWTLHYFNVASGNCGTAQHRPEEARRIRLREAKAAARVLGATFHPPFLDDLEIFYDDASLRRVTAVIREVQPDVILTQSPQDYMEDHMTVSRLTVTAAFARGMANYRSRPHRAIQETAVTVYHAMPHGLRDGLGRLIVPGAFVDTASVHARKREALACHESQKAWLDVSQGMGSYLHALDEFSQAVGRMSGRFAHAEGWRRHSHLGFCPSGADPLAEALERKFRNNSAYQKSLERRW